MPQRPVKIATPDWQDLNAGFGQLVAQAEVFWRNNANPAGPRTIVVDLMNQEVRMAVRCLTVAAAITRVEPARIVVLTGPDPAWLGTVWSFYEPDKLTELARAYGADLALDLAGSAADRIAGAATLNAGDDSWQWSRPRLSDADIDRVADATIVRILGLPRVTDDTRTDPTAAAIAGRTRAYADVYATVFERLDACAFITTHIDYSQWGVGVETAVAAGVPVIHVQTTGNLKAYAMFPDNPGPRVFRQHVTLDLARMFETHVWPNRELFRRPAELVAWRARGNLGRPSWWRAAGYLSQVQCQTLSERSALRAPTLRRLGLDPAKPVVAVFNHAVSDALGTNLELFGDLADWFEQTASFATRATGVNWLFVDHPQQHFYDKVGHFDSVAEQCAGSHMVFVPSLDLSKDELWSMTDLAVTVRGSVSAEYPAYGIPALQAGWSEWSHLKMSEVADSVGDYFDRLTDSIDALVAGRPLITAEQVERARLWMWFYRAATDVASPLIQPFEAQARQHLFDILRVGMRDIEADADPVFASVARMWRRRDAVLTRFDLTGDGLADRLTAPVGPPPPPPAIGPQTAYDVPHPLARVPSRLTSGQQLPFALGVARGGVIVATVAKPDCVLGLKLAERSSGVRVELECRYTQKTDWWWQQAFPDETLTERAPRPVVLTGPGGVRDSGTLPAPGGVLMLGVDVAAADLDPDGFLLLELRGADADGVVPDAHVGIQINVIEVSPLDDSAG